MNGYLRALLRLLHKLPSHVAQLCYVHSCDLAIDAPVDFRVSMICHFSAAIISCIHLLIMRTLEY